MPTSATPPQPGALAGHQRSPRCRPLTGAGGRFVPRDHPAGAHLRAIGAPGARNRLHAVEDDWLMPLPVAHHDRPAGLGPGAGRLASADGSTGGRRWSWRRAGHRRAVAGQLAAKGGAPRRSCSTRHHRQLAVVQRDCAEQVRGRLLPGEACRTPVGTSARKNAICRRRVAAPMPGSMLPQALQACKPTGTGARLPPTRWRLPHDAALRGACWDHLASGIARRRERRRASCPPALFTATRSFINAEGRAGFTGVVSWRGPPG